MEPQRIDVATASGEILSAYDCRPVRPPFFFVAGSGISYPSVPLAKEITAHCRQKAEARGITRTETTPSSDESEYSFWFDKAYPQPVDRQRYLRGLIESKAITAANLRLAHILLSRKITNLVVTPNFDDFLARSLEIFGERHIVSDDPRTVDRIDLDGTDIQIVHVHGSYRFYDCRNLREELASRARPSPTSSNTMAAFMDRALAFRSPIVVGYSGWEDDVIMAALRRRLEGNALPYRLYWCCYEEGVADSLPPWLLGHNDVRLVVPSPDKATNPNSSHGADQSSKNVTASGDSSVRLAAESVFETLIGKFNLSQPELTSDPVRFYAKRLRDSIYVEGNRDEAVYFLADVVTRLEEAAKGQPEKRAKVLRRRKSGRATQGPLSGIKDLVRRSKYDEVLRAALKIRLTDLKKGEDLELFNILTSSHKHISRKTEQALKSAELIVDLGERLVNRDDPQSLGMFVIDPLLDKAYEFQHLDRYADAIQIYNKMWNEFGSSRNPQVHEKILYAMTRKALALAALKRWAEALALYDQLLPAISKLDPKRFRWLVAQTIFNRAGYLENQNRIEEAVDAYTKFVEMFEGAQDGWTQVLVGWALLNQGKLLNSLSRNSDAIASWDKLISLYGNSEHPQVTPSVAEARKLKVDLQSAEGGDGAS